MTRLRLVIAILLLSVLVAGSMLVYHANQKPIPAHVYEQIQLGMSPEDVKQVIGLPPGNHAKNRELGVGDGEVMRNAFGFGTYLHEAGLVKQAVPEGADRKYWVWDSHWIWVTFDEDRKVVRKALVASGPNLSLIERVRRALGI